MSAQRLQETISDARLDALRQLSIMDTEHDPPFDRIVRMVASFFSVESAGIHLLDDSRQWVKAFEGTRFACAREDSICQFTVEQDGDLIIPDTREDARTRNLSIVTDPPHVRFYAGAPLRTEKGQVVGTLCLIDSQPRSGLSADEQYWFGEFANLVIETMELRVHYHLAQEELQSAIELDAVTGLRNRASLVHAGQRLMEAGRQGVPVGAIKVQLDRMSLINRATGESGNAAVLREAAERLRTLAGPDEMLARGDGDNFILFRVGGQHHELKSLEEWLENRSREVLEAIADPMEVGDQSISISASVGLALFDEGAPVFHVIDAASAASVGAQDGGGNRAVWFTPEAFTDFQQRIDMESELAEAIANDGLAVHYQPIVDVTQSNCIVGVEALVRWPREDRAPVGPDRFIPVAEEVGLIDDLGLWVFERACRDVAAWHARGWDLWVSVNISPVQLNDPDLVGKLTQRASAAGLSCGYIKLEITEAALTDDSGDVDSMLEQLHEAGFLLALDDFGTGYSSLARLIRMPFDTLKVDRGFVNDCPNGPGAAVVISVGGLAGQLGMNLVAEGVEYETHERFLRDNDYILAQGYRYARPMPAAELEQQLESGGNGSEPSPTGPRVSSGS